MKPAAKPQYASVELPFGCAPPRPHCPICGHALLIVGEDSIANVDACRHLAFVFIGEIAEFGYRSADFQKRAAGRRTSQLDLSKLRKFLERIGYGNKLLRPRDHLRRDGVRPGLVQRRLRIRLRDRRGRGR